MPRYRVTISETVYSETVVEAEDEEDAKEIAWASGWEETSRDHYEVLSIEEEGD